MVIVVVGSIIYLAFSGSGESWQGFYYPRGIDQATDPNDSKTFVMGPVFATKEACLAWGRSKVAGKPGSNFECGKNCTFREEIGETVCEESTDY